MVAGRARAVSPVAIDEAPPDVRAQVDPATGAFVVLWTEATDRAAALLPSAMLAGGGFIAAALRLLPRFSRMFAAQRSVLRD